MPCSRGLKWLRSLIGGNVAVAATACVAPLLVLVGELTDHPPPPAPTAHVLMTQPGSELNAPLRGMIYPLGKQVR